MPIVLAAVTVDAIGFGIVMPVLPELITELAPVDLPAATRISGWMLAVFALAQFFAGPVLGNLADRFGRRPVLVASMAAFALDYLLMAAAPSLAWLFLGRVVAGITGATYGSAGAVIADTHAPDKRAGVFGLLGAAFGIGFMLGPAFGGLAATMGTRAPFVVAAILAGGSALALALFLPETLANENRRPFRWRDAHVIGAFRPLFAAGSAAPLLVAWFLWQLGSMVYPATWSFWAAIRFGWDATAIGWSLAWVGFLTVLVQLLMTERAVRRLGERGAGVLGLVAGAVGMFGCAVVTASWQIYVLFVIVAVDALAYPALNGLATRMVDASRQGGLQGGLNSLNSVAQILGPLIAAQSLAAGAQAGFDGAAFVLAGGMMALAALIVAVGLPRVAAAADVKG
ncbi:MFS transporter [Sphingomonas aracearum]|uniref:MFS transporter n=1 Tax=Sphingomonas aracearum TaxID=2283317 RepID=A0A369VZ81_9SPHN|nr:MFS transporter [Sphingomonas aracearum]